MAVAMVEEARAAEARAAARAAAATVAGAWGEVRGPVTWERAVVVAKGQGRVERAAAAKEAVTVAAATAEALAATAVAARVAARVASREKVAVARAVGETGVAKAGSESVVHSQNNPCPIHKDRYKSLFCRRPGRQSFHGYSAARTGRCRLH